MVRLEQLSHSLVERAGDVEMVLYGEALLPILHVSELLPERRGEQRDVVEPPADGLLRAIVCESSVGLVALVVNAVELCFDAD